ncbi:interferon-inducible GTPase 5-like [Triplophysa dalaica]|uniref:interferon-inducible GTPase 5-like n=1 Tax=Triplophysa dalaica TaxID=1582913 RepID=UPI0024DF439F|nr:interferon-inducible GTPase 5-like [Triplophysa dalaica]
MSGFEHESIMTEEEKKELTEILANQDISSATNTIKEYLKQKERVELNIGVTGESGSGKSKFVNAFRGLGDEDEDSAKTGPVETTMEPKVYPHPKYTNVKVWDLPGIGTPNFKADEYLQLVEFERYDFFIIVASDRFREYHTKLAKEIIRTGKQFYFIRSKIDVAIDGEKDKENFDQKKILDTIRENCVNGLNEIDGVDDPVVFLISSRDLSKYDFNRMHERIEKELPQHKRHVLIMTLPNITLEINEKKKEALKKGILKVALLSACVAAVPVAGLSIAVDLSIITFEIRKYLYAFGLDEKSLKNLCEQSGQTMETLENLITSVWYKGLLTGSLLPKLRDTTLLMSEDAVERVFSIVPIIGSLVAGGLSFLTVKFMLNKALNDIAEDARKVLMAAFKNLE